jgi:citronellol/citronellal dehydrogenase
MNLKGKTIFISGASRGIGLAIVKRAAADGANVAIAAKTAEPNPKLPGTIYSAAEEIEAAGGKALPLQCDIRDEEQVVAAARKTADTFGGIDILVNNASAINLTPTEATAMKRFDLMFGVNVRGTFLCTQACLPYLKQRSAQAQPARTDTIAASQHGARWFARTSPRWPNDMSMCVLGHAEEFRPWHRGNALWPRTVIQTAALQMIPA